jgi:hypothetical protein
VLPVVADIVTLARDLAGLREALRGVRRDKRDRLATYLEQIASCLDDAQKDLQAGGSAVRACSELHQYVDLIPPTVDRALGADRTETLRTGLRSALQLRGLPQPSVHELEQLDEAAGSFNALASYLRVSS